MDDAHLYDEAETCRQQAFRYLGQPEASFLLRVAHEFERLAAQCKSNSGEEHPRSPL